MLAAVIAHGEPLRDLHPMFDLPKHSRAPAVVAAFSAIPGSAIPCDLHADLLPAPSAARPAVPSTGNAAGHKHGSAEPGTDG